MKKRPSKGVTANRIDANEILPQYDFKRASSNKFASRYAAGSTVIVLEPDVAAFPGSGEANEALRLLAGLIQKHRDRRPTSRRGRFLEKGRSGNFHDFCTAEDFSASRSFDYKRLADACLVCE
jgi:hypothetical protein